MEINNKDSFLSQYNEIANIEYLSTNIKTDLTMNVEVVQANKVKKKALQIFHENKLVAYILYDNKVEGVWYAPFLEQGTLKKLEKTDLPLQRIFLENFQACQRIYSTLTDPQKKFAELVNKTLFYGVHFSGNCEATLGLYDDYVHEFPQFHPTIAIAPFNEIVLGNSFGHRTQLATRELYDCIGIVGYDEKKRYGFVAHLGVSAVGQKDFLDSLVEAIRLYTAANEGSKEDLSITLCGGLKGKSDEALAILLETIQKNSWKLVSKEHLMRYESIETGQSVSLNLLTGQINYELDSKYSIFKSQGSEISQFSEKFFEKGLERGRRVYPFIAYASLSFEKTVERRLSDVLGKLSNCEAKEQYVHFWLLEILKSNHTFTQEDLLFVISQEEFLKNGNLLMIWQIIVENEIKLPDKVMTKLKNDSSIIYESLFKLYIKNNEKIKTLIVEEIPFPLALIEKVDDEGFVYILDNQPEIIQRIDQADLIGLADLGHWEKLKSIHERGKVLDIDHPELEYLQPEAKRKLLHLFGF